MPSKNRHDNKLPYLQLYVSDLIRDCEHLPLDVFGAWMKILCRMHTANPRGIVRLTLDQLSRLVGTSPDKAGVILKELKNPDNPTGSPVLDFRNVSENVFELRSRRMLRDEEKRIQDRKNGALGGNPKLLAKSESKRATQNRRDNPGGGEPLKAKSQSQSHISREVSLEPSSRVPPATRADQSEPQPEVDLSVAPSDTPQASPRKGARKLSDAELATRKAFIDWWTLDAWPRHVSGGEEYPFGAEASRNGAAVTKLLTAVKHDLAQAKQVALSFLTADDAFISKQRRPLFVLGQQLTTWISAARSTRAIQNQRGNANGYQRIKPTAAERGEYREPQREIPTL